MSPSEQLNRTEVRLATMVWQGHTNPEIAAVFGTSEQVIKNHLRNIFDKLGVWSRLELALYVAAHGGASWGTPVRIDEKVQVISAPAALAQRAGSRQLDATTGMVRSVRRSACQHPTPIFDTPVWRLREPDCEKDCRLIDSATLNRLTVSS